MIFNLKFNGLKDIWTCIFPGTFSLRTIFQNKEMIIQMLKTSQNRRKEKSK